MQSIIYMYIKHQQLCLPLSTQRILGISLFCLFSLLFFFPAILFFQPIMVNILLQAIYYVLKILFKI